MQRLYALWENVTGVAAGPPAMTVTGMVEGVAAAMAGSDGKKP